MTTVLFVHGTGVRGIADSATMDTLTARVAKRLPGVAVRSVDWGDAFGATITPHMARLLRVPIPDGPGAPDPVDPQEAELRLWAVLMEHPEEELRGHAAARAADAGAGVVAAGLPRKVANKVHRLDVAAVVDDAGATWPGVYAEVVDEVFRSEVFRAAAPLLTANGDHDVVARAVVARFGHELARRERVVDPLTAEQRDRLFRAVRDACGGVTAGAARDIVSGVLKDVLMYATWPLQSMLRGGTLGGNVPRVGDILHYQAHGAVLRRYLAERVADVQGPVLLLAHSLGGIAAFEMLAERHDHDTRRLRAPLDRVVGLITVGSQIGYFAAVNALATGPVSAPGFAVPWVNLWNPRDWLSFEAAPVLGEDRVRDVEVGALQPFPAAHGAYWTREVLYREMAGMLGEPR